MYSKDDFSYGFEAEWGDVNRGVVIPDILGSWEHSETDIINLRAPYAYKCADPLGIAPDVGGEINTKPSISIHDQIAKIALLQQLFENNHCEPTTCITSHAHVHIHVKGLIEDLPALKRLVAYIKQNQAVTIAVCGQYRDYDEIRRYKGAKMYLKYDGGRLMPDYMCDNIINLAKDFNHFIKLHAAGKDGVSMGRPFRYGINTYSLKHTKTVEFRFFRNTLDLQLLHNCFEFCEQFLLAALNDGDSVKDLLEHYNWTFPPFKWDSLQYQGWLETKYGKERGKKQRTYYELA